MADWIDDLHRTAASGGETPALPRELIAALAEDFAPLDAIRAGLARDACSYVVLGAPATALPQIATQDACERLGLNDFQPPPRARRVWYERATEVPPCVMVRLLKLIAAVPIPFAGYLSALSAFTPPWVATLFVEAAGRRFGTWYNDSARLPPALSAGYMESMLEIDGLAPSTLISGAFCSDVKQGYGNGHAFKSVTHLAGYSEAVLRHADATRPAFSAKAHEQRLHALEMLAGADREALQPFARELALLGTDSSAQVRNAAAALARKIGAEVAPHATEILGTGKPGARIEAARLLWAIGQDLDDAALLDAVREQGRRDKAASVTEAIAQLESGSAPQEAVAEALSYPMPEIDLGTEPPPAAQAAFMEGAAAFNQAAKEVAARFQAQAGKTIRPLNDAELSAIWDYVRGAAAERPKIRVAFDHHLLRGACSQAFAAFLGHPGVKPAHILRLHQVTSSIAWGRRLAHDLAAAVDQLYREGRLSGLLELALILERIGESAELVLIAAIGSTWGYGPLGADWPSEHVWPLYAHYLDQLRAWLSPAAEINRTYDFDRDGLFEALAALPVLPADVVNSLFELALGTGKQDRPRAQAALAKVPSKEPRIIAALADGRAEVRAVAADWLARLGHTPAIPELEAALKKEKNDVVIGTLLSALEALGVDVDRYLDRAGLPERAEKALAKGLPADLAWVPWDRLPEVRWAADGTTVPLVVIQWLLVQAHKQKSPEPSAMLRRYGAMLDPGDRVPFGQYILDAWLAWDIAPIPREEAERRALQSAQSTYQAMQSWPKYYQESPYWGKSVQEIYAMILPSALKTPAGSAIGSKGILAVAAACAGGEAAQSASRYLKEWYGQRAAQGKALIAMLAWIEHPSATQLMLSVGNRFRTKGFQDEAMRQAGLLAERKGWTLDELADRTIPSAGFDNQGEMELDYGTRRFLARLTAELKVELLNPEGKVIASLPDPRKDEDEARAKECKKALSTAKKEIKSVVQLQGERLYEALCAGRRWRFEDWSLYLNAHPILRRLVQRLVWARFEDDEARQSFRPLDDGSLTDADDNPITLEPDDRVGIAHDCNLPAEEVTRWQQHLADYAVSPLFAQFGKDVFELDEARQDATEIADFLGHLLQSFSLRGRMTKLGYGRGAAEDGGWFYTYEKRFPALGLIAVIEFTGSPLPEENRTVALKTLSFSPLTPGANAWSRSTVKLGTVPRVLLSECYDDLRSAAAEGGGFDAEWEKKTAY